MRKLLLTLLLVFSAVLFVGCQGNSYEIAMVTDYGDITDQSFNQSTWEAVKDYAETNKKSYAYYKPAGDSTAERVAKVEQAIKKGAKIVVMPGFAFAETVYEMQDEYPDVKFVALDVAQGDVEGCFYVDPYAAEPVLKDANNQPHISSNVVLVVFQEEEAGYLAGYAAVKNGERSLGFLGGMAVPAVVRYGYGYLQGIADAAAELEVEVKVWYIYGGQFFGDATIKASMDQWVSDGCKTIFACGGGIFTSVLDAIAGKTGHNLIGVDVDQSLTLPNDPVLTSAMKGLRDATITCLDAFYNNAWDGGKAVTYGLKTDTTKEYVGLPRATWSMDGFTIEDYNAVLAKIRAGQITIDPSHTKDVTEFGNQYVKFQNTDNLGGSIK